MPARTSSIGLNTLRTRWDAYSDRNIAEPRPNGTATSSAMTVVMNVAATSGSTPHALSSQLDLLPNDAVHSVPVRNSTGLTWRKNVTSGANSDTTMPSVINTDNTAAATRQLSMTFSPIRRRPEVRPIADPRWFRDPVGRASEPTDGRPTVRLRPC